MMNLESLEAVHTHTHTHTIHSTKKNGNYLLDERELQFSKIDIKEDKGTEFAFICDREKDRNKANANLDFYVLHRNLGWLEQGAYKSLFVQIA